MHSSWTRRLVVFLGTAALLQLITGEKITLAADERRTPARSSGRLGRLSAAPAFRPGIPEPVTLNCRAVNGVPVQVVTVHLRSSRVRVVPQLSRRGIGSTETLAAMTRRTDPLVALTGTFFDTRTLRPVGDIVIGGRLVHFGGRGAALCLRRVRGGGLHARIRPNAGRDRHTAWGERDTVLAGGMWLVRRSRVALSPRRQGFRDPGLLRPSPRVAVGLTRDGRLLLAATTARVSLRRWALSLRQLGAVDALNYDGGSSTGLYYRGRPIIRPRRRLTNALAVFVAEAQPVRPRARVALIRRGKSPADRT